MKKTLVALATLSTLAATAEAQSNVTIGGVIQADVKNYWVGNTSRPAVHEIRVDDDYSSRFWLSGTEDLGGGLSALFYVQNRFNADVRQSTGNATDAGLADGDTYVGLKSSTWGQLTAGKHTMMAGEGVVVEYSGNGTPAFPASDLATNSILGFIGSQNLTHSRINNSILYKSPTFSGFSGSLGFAASGSNGNEGNLACTGTGVINAPYFNNPLTSGGGGAPGAAATLSSTASTTCPTLTTPGAAAGATPVTNPDYSNGGAYFAKLNYTNGPLYLNVAYWATRSEGRPIAVTVANADQRQVRASGSYTWNGIKVGLQFDRAELLSVGRSAAGAGGIDIKRNAWEIPVSYTFGPHAILASYTRANDFSGTSNSGAKMWVIGYDLSLSKRTDIGLFYSKLTNDALGTYQPYKSGTSQNGSALLAGESASILTLAIKHMF